MIELPISRIMGTCRNHGASLNLVILVNGKQEARSVQNGSERPMTTAAGTPEVCVGV